MSTQQNTSRPALGLPPRPAAAPTTDAPLARMLPGRRQEVLTKKEEPKEAPTENMTRARCTRHGERSYPEVGGSRTAENVSTVSDSGAAVKGDRAENRYAPQG